MYHRQFTLRHEFNNFAELKEEISPAEEHFGVKWSIQGKHNETSFSLCLFCDNKNNDADEEPWSIDTTYEFRVLSVTGKGQPTSLNTLEFEEDQKCEWKEFRTWEYMMENQVVDDTVIIECKVTIDEIVGIAEKRRIEFGVPREKMTDCVIIVGDEKFHISKVLLATFSTYFNALFFGNFAEAEQAEITLRDVDPDAFQNFLENIYGEWNISSENVEDLLELAERFDVKTVRNQCEEFLLHFDGISDKEKFRIADSYRLTVLQNHFLEDVNTVEDVRALLPADVTDLSQETLATLFRLTISPP